MALLLGLGVVISYFDRLNMSVASHALEHDYGLSPFQVGLLLSSYLWSYALLQIPVGAWLDRFGVRRMLGAGSFFWSIATFLTGAAPGLNSLIGARVMLGVAESPAFPGAAKAVGLWFPRRERSLATSAFDAAAKFSNVIGTPIVAAVVAVAGWRAGFWFTGTLTALFGLLFWNVYRDPADHPGLSTAEREYIASGGGQQEAVRPVPATQALPYLLSYPQVWGLILGFAAYGYAFYMLITWLPGYLADTFKMDVLQSGWYAVIPWIGATISDVLVGGWLVDHLIASDHDPAVVRKRVLSIGMLMGLAVIGAAYTDKPQIAIAWISVALAGLAFAAPVGWSLPGLIAPPEMVGTVAALMNFSNNVAGIIAPIATGFIVSRTHSFSLAFTVAAGVLALGVIIYSTLLGRIEQIPSLAGAIRT